MDEKKYLAIICGDWNDGDEVHNVLHVNLEEATELIRVKTLIDNTLNELKSISTFRRMNLERLICLLDEMVEYDYKAREWRFIYESQEDPEDEEPEYLYLSKLPKEDLYLIKEFWHEHMPSGYECSCHTLRSIEVYEITNKIY